MLELPDRHCKATAIKMFQRAMTNTLETNEKIGSPRQER